LKPEIQVKVFCILGDERVFRSKSPLMFQEVLKRSGINGMYVPLMVEPDKIGKAVQSLKTLNFAGANVTVPYKEAVIPHLDILSEGANIIGAVNTIIRDGDTLKGYNTNAIGFMDALDEAGFDVADKKTLIFGTGGAARAVAFIFNWLRAESVLIAGRSENKAKAVASRIEGEAAVISSIGDKPVRANIIVNATSVSSPDEDPELEKIARSLEISGCEMVVDLNYGRTVNFWRDMAEERGIPFMDGLSTLAFQAKRTFALWTRIQVNPAEFRKMLDA
jgi:shikimate dehydrogenase